MSQPGKVAIVYNQPAEALEYKAYIEYLQSLGYLTGPVETLELGELQGVADLGRRARRALLYRSAEDVGDGERDVRKRYGRECRAAEDALTPLKASGRRIPMDLYGIAVDIHDPVVAHAGLGV